MVPVSSNEIAPTSITNAAIAEKSFEVKDLLTGVLLT